MKTSGSIVILSAVVVSVFTPAFHNSLAADTNAATVGTVDMQFINAPPSAAINWLARLTGKPVIAPLNITALITYKTERKVTPDEAVRELTAVLESNKLYLMNANGMYYRLATTTETNKLADIPHAEIVVREDQVLIEGRSVRWEDLPKALGVLVMPEAEVWVFDPKAQPGPDSAQLTRLLAVLNQTKAGRIYRAYLPPRK
jgi:hypothetical protein